MDGEVISFRIGKRLFRCSCGCFTFYREPGNMLSCTDDGTYYRKAL